MHSQENLNGARIASNDQGVGGLLVQFPIKFGEFINSVFEKFSSQVDKAYKSDPHPNNYRYYKESENNYDEAKYDDDYDDTQAFEEWRIEMEKR